MKYIPHALTVAMIGVILSIRGMFEHSLKINIIGGALVALGVMTDKQARKLNVGGEVLAFVW